MQCYVAFIDFYISWCRQKYTCYVSVSTVVKGMKVHQTDIRQKEWY